jgi:hypothetical protein
VGLSTLCQALETGGGGSEAVDGGGRAQRPCESVHLSDQFGRDRGECYYLVFTHLPFIVTSSPVLSASLTRALYEPSTDPAAPGLFRAHRDEVLGGLGWAPRAGGEANGCARGVS